MSHAQYNTFQIWIKKGHRLYTYLDETCRHAKNLYNTTNFYVRQIFTALRQQKPLEPLQKEVLDTLVQYIEMMNERQQKAYASRAAKKQRKPADKQPELHCKLFELPTKENPYVDYEFLDCLFKVMEHENYRALPTQSSQWVIKSVFHNWKSFFASIKDYCQHPEKYKGKPRIPKYCRDKEKEIQFTNQDCVITDGKFLKFPKTKLRLNIGKLGYTQGTLRQVRVIPKVRAIRR